MIHFEHDILDRFNAHSTSAAERQQMYGFWCEIRNMDQHVLRFQSALQLYEFSQQETQIRMRDAHHWRDRVSQMHGADRAELIAKCHGLESDALTYRSWGHMAARDGALTLMQLIHLCLQTMRDMQVSGLFEMCEIHGRRQESRTIFQHAFPGFMTIWDDLDCSMKEAETGAQNTSTPYVAVGIDSAVGRSLILIGTLEGDTFQVNHQNSIHGYDLYGKNAMALQKIIDVCKTSFIECVTSVNHRI